VALVLPLKRGEPGALAAVPVVGILAAWRAAEAGGGSLRPKALAAVLARR
jgi:hypothetical protein